MLQRSQVLLFLLMTAYASPADTSGFDAVAADMHKQALFAIRSLAIQAAQTLN